MSSALPSETTDRAPRNLTNIDFSGSTDPNYVYQAGSDLTRINAEEILSSVSHKEAADKSPDEKIYEMLMGAKFTFGGKEHTVGEAVPQFVYEIGLDLTRIYVIVLTVNFGTVIFYVPEEAQEAIFDRVHRINSTFRGYVSRIIEHGPAVFSLTYALGMMGITAEQAAASLTALSQALNVAKKDPVDLKTKSNNWLKLHGYPMRRRLKGRRKIR